MTEEDARKWIDQRFGFPRGTIVQRLVERVRAVNAEQNLIAASTLETIWTRHVLDSAQLVPLAAEMTGLWLDIGSGAGFPGLVVAALVELPVLLVEPRRLRAEFLRQCVDDLGLTNVEVIQAKVEAVQRSAAVISARAVAKLPDLLRAAQHCATRETLWLLPKGRSVHEEVADAKRAWHGTFHVEPSLTSPGSAIVVAKGVSPR
jgi:16S rRNA (guanine527-N7)-methyltransferase